MYGLLVSFPDQSETFVLGFEAGQLWEIMRVQSGTFISTVHAKNRELVTRMAASCGLTPEFTALEGDDSGTYLSVKFTRGTKPKLTVVS